MKVWETMGYMSYLVLFRSGFVLIRLSGHQIAPNLVRKWDHSPCRTDHLCFSSFPFEGQEREECVGIGRNSGIQFLAKGVFDK